MTGQGRSLAIRAGLTLACVIGGSFFPWLFLLAAFFAWTVYSDLRAPKDGSENEWFIKRWTVTADDPNWKSFFLPFCESPAEKAFLEAMVEDYVLRPEKGLLKGNGLTLDLQHKVPSYRFDFLANGWLNIEVDGAAWHSSEEAIARDQARDEATRAAGYEVLRIPAKVVFQAPHEAVQRVRRKIAEGPPAKANQSLRAEWSPRELATATSGSIGEAFSALATGVNEVNARVRLASEVKLATADLERATHTERAAFENAIAVAEQRLETQRELAEKGDEYRQVYEKALADLRALVDETKPAPSVRVTGFELRPVLRPGRHDDPVVDFAIQQKVDRLMEGRERFLAAIREKLADQQLARATKEALTEMGCADYWPIVYQNTIGA